VHVEQWMTRKVHCTKPLDSINHARELMATHRVNQLPVVVDGRVVGIVTDRDLRDAFPSVFERTREGVRKPPQGADPSTITVEMVMTENVLTLAPKDTVAEAARRMRTERIGALPVVDNGHIVGILARSDLLDALVALAERA